MNIKQMEISVEISEVNKRILTLAQERKMNYAEIDKLVIERYYLQKQFYREYL